MPRYPVKMHNNYLTLNNNFDPSNSSMIASDFIKNKKLLSNSKDPKVKSNRLLEPLFGGANNFENAADNGNTKSGTLMD